MGKKYPQLDYISWIIVSWNNDKARVTLWKGWIHDHSLVLLQDPARSMAALYKFSLVANALTHSVITSHLATTTHWHVSSVSIICCHSQPLQRNKLTAFFTAVGFFFTKYFFLKVDMRPLDLSNQAIKALNRDITLLCFFLECKAHAFFVSTIWFVM